MWHNSIKKLQTNIKKKGVLALVVVAACAGVLVGVGALPHSNASILGDIQQFIKGMFPGVIQEAPAMDTQEYSGTAPLSKPVYDYEAAVIGAVEKTTPAVVSIVITKDLPVIERCPYNPFGDLPPDIQQFFGFGGFDFSQPCQKGTQKQEVGGGSGFIVSSDGLIVTNKHVVSDEKAEYSVLLNDGSTYDATVVALHPALDIALVRIKANNLPVVTLGNSETLKLGQSVIAIGNALGEFRNTVSVGVVSGLARTITAADQSGQAEEIRNVIQTDAAINPGNSGGPLLNLYGEVIGINVATVSGAQNIGFAIPINEARQAVESVQRNGKISFPFLGVRYVTLNKEIAAQYGVSQEQGALLKGNDSGFAVQKGSPADKAGLKEGDVITHIDGEEVTKERTLADIIGDKKVGDTVTLTVERGRETLHIEATLTERE